MRPTPLLTSSLVAAAALLFVAPPVQAGGDGALECRAKRRLKVYGIGSSTMGTTLGPILKRELRARGARVRVWGKASSGLARPDFHDWLAEAPGLVRTHRPDVFVVSLGTNDGQNMRVGDHWIGFENPKWRRIYAKRVDKLLATLSGKRRRRPIIWLGPTVLPSHQGHERMEVVRDIIAERIARFDGPVIFIDGLKRTVDRKGHILKTVRSPKSGKRVDARADDNVHLTVAGVRWLLAEPILKQLRPCLTRSADAKRARKDRDG